MVDAVRNRGSYKFARVVKDLKWCVCGCYAWEGCLFGSGKEEDCKTVRTVNTDDAPKVSSLRTLLMILGVTSFCDTLVTMFSGLTYGMVAVGVG